IPGAITPPRYSPLGDTTSHVVAVPKSTTMQPALISSYAATALTIRSAPTSRGFSYRIGMPLLIPAPTTSAGPPQWRLKNCCNPNSVGGTTDEMIPALIERHGKPSMSSSVLISTAYSSEVRSATVWIRQCAASSPSRNTPSTVFVFPTSTASSAVIDRNGSSPLAPVVAWPPRYGCTLEDPRDRRARWLRLRWLARLR